MLRVRGVPLRAHWSTPFGALLLSGFDFQPGIWLGFLILVVLHELGHAAFVRFFKKRILAVELHMLGGACIWDVGPFSTPFQQAVIAWGGVAAQAVVLIAALAYRFLGPAPSSSFGLALLSSLIKGNLLVMALNLVPMEPFDGAQAWQLFPVLKQRRAQRRQRSQDEQAQRERQERRQVDLDDFAEQSSTVANEAQELLDRLMGDIQRARRDGAPAEDRNPPKKEA